MAKKKRKATKKQLAALARGRAAQKRKRRAKATRKKTPRRSVASVPYRRKKRTTTKKGTRTMAKRKAPKRRRKAPARRRSGGGRRGGLMSGIEWKDMAGAAAYGWMENQVKEKGDEALLKKVPLFFHGIGYAGCLGVLAHFAGKQVGGAAGAALRHLSKGTLDVAAYKLMRNGELYKDEAAATSALAGDGEVGYGAIEGVEVGFSTDPDEISGDDDEVGYGADGPGY